ncbi:hypothetical protein BpHYR1_025092 [Brachionus plicatilis]|uniref:Uncharacterized protein n=1 Tax=Brachionus plicatilis TaxID=10195 RepID=A0A3M7RGF7_BRAPC|nr:hypothetical protein BpHYR1_025092 [Brachionus plicatilis]
MSFVRIAHPKIYRAIEVFQKQEAAANLINEHSLGGKPPPPRKKLDIFKDIQFNSFRKILLSNDLTLDCYVNDVMPLFIFRKTKTLKGNESDESDSEGEDSNIRSDEEETLD